VSAGAGWTEQAGNIWDELERRGPDRVVSGGVELGPGSRVRLRPQPGRDPWDAALAGRAARVERVEQDLEGNLHLAVSLDDDPGRDLGVGRPGHRFFFAPEEVEPLVGQTILVAGIGNVFLGDDGFGCSVAALLAEEGGLPAAARVVDFGIRGLDLAYALADCDAAVLVDAMPYGDAPGSVTVLEPELDEVEAAVETHGMDPVMVLRLAHRLGTLPPRVLVVGCRPARIVDTDAGDDLDSGLSAPVAAAVPEAARVVRSLVAELLEEEPKGGDPK
jgi:hydrogenase maturation protease